MVVFNSQREDQQDISARAMQVDGGSPSQSMRMLNPGRGQGESQVRTWPEGRGWQCRQQCDVTETPNASGVCPRSASRTWPNSTASIGAAVRLRLRRSRKFTTDSCPRRVAHSYLSSLPIQIIIQLKRVTDRVDIVHEMSNRDAESDGETLGLGDVFTVGALFKCDVAQLTRHVILPRSP